ncbi:SDR family NAD(P)-dependent oxidoreductase [Parafrankia sp. EUN1f]|uniref:SDR family NAD(P)-dependent oxidoreductase n=1 Tax=Parafrankia sp. EUN1f TaxID=102897 RepID=UPI0001C43959|nr:SDR family oxidoreductase [Parafrankia sp. EUN1f]EFC86083.1 short-chain dehydrogenase/reductase SDR [Parafrankia sp. EUN1f]
MELEGKTALITGSTGGIGRETARLMAAAGARVVVTGRDAARGAALVEEIAAACGSARFVAADLADPAGPHRLASLAGPVDILVNNAAAIPSAPTVSQDVESLDAALAINVRAPYLLTAALAPAMVEKGAGSIVNISTLAARVGMPGFSAYGATKAALESLSRAWATEFGPAGVRVNTVVPGPTGTDALVAATGADGLGRLARNTLLGRLATPHEIAETVVFLASDRTRFITGATIAAGAGRPAI